MTGPTTIEKPEIDSTNTSGGGKWIVTVYDNDKNTVDEVVLILIIATRCTMREAETETWEVHHLGKSVVHHGAEKECRKVADVIATIGIQVEASEES